MAVWYVTGVYGVPVWMEGEGLDVAPVGEMVVVWCAGWGEGKGGSDEGGGQQWGPGDGSSSVEWGPGALGPHHV